MLAILLVFHSQAAEDRAGDRNRPIGQPLSDGRRVDVVHTAGIDDDVNTLKRQKELQKTDLLGKLINCVPPSTQEDSNCTTIYAFVRTPDQKTCTVHQKALLCEYHLELFE